AVALRVCLGRTSRRRTDTCSTASNGTNQCWIVPYRRGLAPFCHLDSPGRSRTAAVTVRVLPRTVEKLRPDGHPAASRWCHAVTNLTGYVALKMLTVRGGKGNRTVRRGAS